MKKREHEGEEFRAEHPATEERVLYKTGEKVKEDGAYVCINCVTPDKPPMVNLHKGDMIPVCGACGPLSRWSHI
jgi:hypothetical protein